MMGNKHGHRGSYADCRAKVLEDSLPQIEYMAGLQQLADIEKELYEDKTMMTNLETVLSLIAANIGNKFQYEHKIWTYEALLLQIIDKQTRLLRWCSHDPDCDCAKEWRVRPIMVTCTCGYDAELKAVSKELNEDDQT